MALPPAPSATLRRARIAVSALFLVNGALMANVLPRLPAIKADLGLSNAELGAAMAAMPIGGLAAGGLAGVAIGRLGSGRLTVATGVLYGLVLGLVGVAPVWAALAAAFLVLGALDAVMDAGMNAHGVAVERGYGRSILQGFHGWWSAGTLVGAATGTAAAAVGVPLAVHLGGVGLVLAVAALLADRALLPGRDVDSAPGEAAGLSLPEIPRVLRVLAPIALVGVLGVMLEDAAQTWSAVYLAEVLETGPGVAGLAFVVYTGAMTLGRLTNDRWIDRWDRVLVAQAGAATASIGLAAVAAAGIGGGLAPAVVGFALVGLGTSSLFPVMVAAAAGRSGVPSAHAIAAVSWLARAGFVVAPLLVGTAADRFGLASAFVIPLVAGLSVAVFAPLLLRGRSLPARA